MFQNWWRRAGRREVRSTVLPARPSEGADGGPETVPTLFPVRELELSEVATVPGGLQEPAPNAPCEGGTGDTTVRRH